MNNDYDDDDGVGKAALPFSDMDGWMDCFFGGGADVEERVIPSWSRFVGYE